MKITHYDLFAGIGGFSLALDTIFYDSEIKHIFCEWESFPTAILRKHWPDGTYYGDIADLVADTASKQGGGVQQFSLQSDAGPGFTVLTGGFPCQPFSHAGRRKGTSDDRYKWPDMFAVIQNVRPEWVIAENVRGLVTWNDGMVLETVCADLESEGYEVQPLIIPAVAIGAPHRRDRVWIVAHSQNTNGRGELRNILSKDAEKSEPQEQHEDKSGELSDAGGDATNPINGRQRGEEREGTAAQDSLSQEYRAQDSAARELERADSNGVFDGYASNPRQQLREPWSGKGVEADTTIGATRAETNQREHQYTWADDWREVAFASCDGSLDDGLPRDMAGLTISYAKYRRESLKSVGNSIVPQVAMQIFEAIKVVIHTP